LGRFFDWAIPLDIEHRRKASGSIGNVPENQAAFLHGPAPIGEMIGAARHAAAFAEAQFWANFSSTRSPPSVALIQAKRTPAAVHTAPIDIALIFGDIDAANLIIAGPGKRASPVTPPAQPPASQREAEQDNEPRTKNERGKYRIDVRASP